MAKLLSLRGDDLRSWDAATIRARHQSSRADGVHKRDRRACRRVGVEGGTAMVRIHL